MAASASSLAPAALSGKCQLSKPECLQLEGTSSCFLCADPVSRKNVKSAHSTRNRYSSQWTLTKCQASTPARTLTSDWRTVGSQHGVTVTESDSYSASLSQDTGKPKDLPSFCSLSSSSPIIHLHLWFSQLLESKAQVSFISSWSLTHCVAMTKTLDLAELCLVKDFILFSQKITEKMVHMMFAGEKAKCCSEDDAYFQE